MPGRIRIERIDQVSRYDLPILTGMTSSRRDRRSVGLHLTGGGRRKEGRRSQLKLSGDQGEGILFSLNERRRNECMATITKCFD